MMLGRWHSFIYEDFYSTGSCPETINAAFWIQIPCWLCYPNQVQPRFIKTTNDLSVKWLVSYEDTTTNMYAKAYDWSNLKYVIKKYVKLHPGADKDQKWVEWEYFNDKNDKLC